MENSIDTKVIRRFGLTSLSLRNKISIFLLTGIIILFGIYSYRTLPKELFPEVNMPWIMIMTPYPGNPPIDIENLITREIEKEVESVSGIKKITSNSTQGASMIFIEFNFDIDVKSALQDIKDAVDKVKSELPGDLPADPMVMDIDFSEFPIQNINLSGDYSIDELKTFADKLEDEIESIAEISKVAIQGVNEKEIQINVDPIMLESYEMSFGDVESAIMYENMSVSSGEIINDGTKRSIRVIGEFQSLDEIKNIIVKAEKGNIIYMRDLAEVKETYEYPTSFARLDKEPVVSVQVVKKGGENLLNATKKIETVLEELADKGVFPDDLKITVTNDQSEMIKKQLSNLENSMIISIIFVVVVLYFFLGTRNALFVGVAIPLSMFLSFIVLNAIGWRINMIVLFSLILALGMLVDNAIVVVENVYRFVANGFKRDEASDQGVGEIAIAIIASTATTLAAFFPLSFWDSLMGEFMKYLPITLIIVLTSSLLVALVIVPVMTATFIKKDAQNEPPNAKRSVIIAIGLAVLSILFFVGGSNTMGNLFALGAILTIMNVAFLNKVGKWFQNVLLVKMENSYLKVIRWTLKGYRPLSLFVGTFVLMILTMMFFGASNPRVEFFPSSDPKFINIMAELPIGTDIHKTDEFMKQFEEDIFRITEKDSAIIESIVTNVGAGAKLEDDIQGSMEENPHKGLVTVTFLDYELRNGTSSAAIMAELSDSLIGKYPGVRVIAEKNSMGPPTGKPINMEVAGDDYDQLILICDNIINYINEQNIKGIEGLKLDVDLGKPEMLISVDRERARRFGLSTGQIAGTLRTALFGKEVSDFKVGEEKYPINLRLKEEYRYNTAALLNQKITFRNNMGKLMQIPISAVADIKYTSSFGAVKRKNLDRVITIYSNVIEGHNANEINQTLKSVMADYEVPEGYSYKFTGEQEDQQESAEFLATALLMAVALIMIILVSQFNSAVKPLIIIASVLFSTIGVFGGLALFKMDFVIVMTGIGIVSLAGVVVNNAIVLIDYIDLLKARRRKELGLNENEFLPTEIAVDCIVQAGKTRLRPVLLTAITTILGLIPMAIGININFETMLSDFDPQFSMGGDMNAMWGPMSWTVIFGLTFATFLTLIIVPVMYRLATRTKYFTLKKIGKLPKHTEI